MKTFAQIIGDYVLNLSYDHLPHDVVDKCKALFLDTLGVMVLGANTPWSKSVLAYFKEQGGAQEADVVYHGVKLPSSSTAFVNGTMAHSFDYDDDLAACHVATCVIPAALAIGQKLGVSGRKLITAIVAGYDVTVRLAETLDGHHLYAMGFHPTPVCGTFGAAVATAKLLDLSRDQVVHALGIAGSFPSGSMEWLSDGSMTKRFHGGKSASEGIIASLLAQKGFTGPSSIFEGKNGIFPMFQAQRPHDTLIHQLSERFDILKSYIKLYPCCTCNAPIIDAVTELRKAGDLNPGNIERIEIRLRKTCMALVGEPLERKQHPETILEAQMSAPYCSAVALLDGEVFPPQFSPERIKDAKVQELARKTQVVWDENLEMCGTPRPVPAEIIITMLDGRMLRKRVDYQKGTYRNPLTPNELKRKFFICVKGRLSEQNADLLLNMIENLEKIEDIQTLKSYDDTYHGI